VLDHGRVGLEIRVLGPVEISSPSRSVVLSRRLERALTVRLALARGVPVLDDVLVRELWGDAELARPAERLRVLASRLRASLGDLAPALRRTDGGYALAAAPVDLVAMEAARTELHAALRTGDHEAVRRAALDALGAWRGPALADLRAVPFAQAEGERLDGVRLDLQVERLAAHVETWRSAEAAGELEELAHRHPLHERVHRLLALAWYRLGRQADALDLLARLRRRLAEELGVDPAPDTAQLELALLRQDSELDVPQPAHRLPELRLHTPITTFLGRDGELAALLEILRSPGLVTLTGTPGSGKTRLALEVARGAQDQDRDVAWVDLASLSEPDSIAAAVAAAVAVDTGPGDPVVRLAGALTDGLLVIDNAEHLVEAVAALVASVLRAATGLSVLVTSQRALLISGEEVHHVQPLSAAAAAALFSERSGARRDALVDTICAAVDCLPLAVELAAGLTRTLTVAQLAGRIDDRLHLLVGGSRDAGQRHTSLRAALDWSYRLLDPPLATVLRRMAVFAGGCSLEAAEHVIAADDLRTTEVAAALTELCDRCLVTVAERHGERRFRLLESVRDYALDLLAGSPEEMSVRARHLDWCARHVAAHDVQGADEAGELQTVLNEWPNLLSALDNAAGTARAADGLRLAIALDNAWILRGLHDQARRHYAALVDADGVSDAQRAQALSNYGFVSAQVGEPSVAAALLDRASRLAEAAGEPELRMRVLYHRGIAFVMAGKPLDAFEPLQNGERIATDLGRDRAVSAFQDVTATAYLYSGDAAAAARLHEEANARDRAAGRTHGLARGLLNEATALLSAGDLGSACRCAAEGAEYAERLGDTVAVPGLRAVYGHVAIAEGHVGAAIEYFRAALDQLSGDEINAQLFRLDLADALLRAGDTAEARGNLERALAASRERGIQWLLAQPTLAAVAVAEREPGAAASILDEAQREYDARGFRWPLALARLRRARALLHQRI
jgi:predicted ATPase/DNA-binding SARP family transcriptional activator